MGLLVCSFSAAYFRRLFRVFSGVHAFKGQMGTVGRLQTDQVRKLSGGPKFPEAPSGSRPVFGAPGPGEGTSR